MTTADTYTSTFRKCPNPDTMQQRYEEFVQGNVATHEDADSQEWQDYLKQCRNEAAGEVGDLFLIETVFSFPKYEKDANGELVNAGLSAVPVQLPVELFNWRTWFFPDLIRYV